MKHTLIFVTIIGILVTSGSLFYYFVIFLPEQNTKSQEDINAIRNVIAPTPEQQRAMQEADRQSMERAKQAMDKAWDEYYQCEDNMREKRDAYLKQQCPSDSYNPLEEMGCRGKAMDSAGYKQFDCEWPSF